MAYRSDKQIVEHAVDLAAKWQNRANSLLTRQEKVYQRKMLRLVTHPMDKVILTRMIDQSFRSYLPKRIADQINFLIRTYGTPAFFSKIEKILMRLFISVGRHFPHLCVPQVVEKMRYESSQTIVPGEKGVLDAYLAKRKGEGIHVNINHIGEAVLGENEAESRLNTYINDLKRPDIECISVKISTIFSQIVPLAFEETVGILVKRLCELYRVAQSHCFVSRDGRRVQKFVNLDMEEFRDLEITTAAFIRALDVEEFKKFNAGIALQAYLPESFEIQRQITEWAKNRVAGGGSPVKIRLVKGANMEMELVESAIHNWPLAPYDNKRDVDANFKRMMTYGMDPENIRAVHLGIASHNLFDLALAYLMATENRVTDKIIFEMLEGMADHIRRAITEISGDVLMYAPVAEREQFISAIAYLIRRLDENTAEENFLRHSFYLQTDSKEWHFLKNQFVESYHHQDKAYKSTFRVQDRSCETFSEPKRTYFEAEFTNEPDTDFALTANRKWAEEIRKKWQPDNRDTPLEIPIVISGKEIFEGKKTVRVFNSATKNEDANTALCIAVQALADRSDIDAAVGTAKADPDGWRQMGYEKRHEILSQAAVELRKARADLIGAAAANTGKVFTESDPEVSEAVDFTEFYPYAARYFSEMKNISCRGKGVGVVISPWNFPIAIPCGGIAASLAAGNTVIFKPASAATLVGWQLCQCFWNAGISKHTLQFVPCTGSEVGSHLTGNPDVDFIILTGGTKTGLAIMKSRPDVFLAGETGGKNATIVTDMADRDLAIKNILHSVFSNCGQKCSATSLLILEKPVYEDEKFKRQLVDAARSYTVGSPWEFQNKMGPLISSPEGHLKNALTRLEPGELWALKPGNIAGNPHLWSPGIKWNVSAGSYTHMTEFFGPVLGVMCAETLERAIELVNQTGYGLTSGLESLDEREHQKWMRQIRAGNLYINRVTTGAVVLRQPFGGMGKSAIGSGIKVGNFNYVTQFMRFEETSFPSTGPICKDHSLLRLARELRRKLYWGQMPELRDELEKTIRAIKSYLYHAQQEFFQEQDYFHLRGQDNVFRYWPVGNVVVRLHEKDTLFETLARIAGVRISDCTLTVSIPPSLENHVAKFLNDQTAKRFLGDGLVVRESDAQLSARIHRIDRIRYAAPERVPSDVAAAAAKSGFYIARNTVLMEGRLELLNYFREQSISHDYHRYGNLGERATIP